ncbi:vegetative cell wall protein gp1-like [Macadamia integrifolia]|uniref:vegetative cell wall protein gp1-like n=1 Tax=Macadamia integrifolia TaxID=60698 RepID=UPI001C5286F2|nr:vegetative cell wall protein gp1-like [Macadamia integrifolia]
MKKRSFASPPSSPPTPPSPLPISVGPGHQKYNFSPSPSPSPPFSPPSSRTSSEINPLLWKDSPSRPRVPSTFSLDRVADELGSHSSSSCLKDLVMSPNMSGDYKGWGKHDFWSHLGFKALNPMVEPNSIRGIKLK